MEIQTGFKVSSLVAFVESSTFFGNFEMWKSNVVIWEKRKRQKRNEQLHIELLHTLHNEESQNGLPWSWWSPQKELLGKKNAFKKIAH